MQSKNTGKNIIVKSIVISSNKVTMKVDGKSVVLSLDSFERYKLYEGQEIVKSFEEELLKQAKEDEYYLYCLKLLNKDGYSSSEIFRRLLKKTSSKALSTKILNKLKSENLIDDYKYVSNYIENIAPYKNLGKRRVIYNLISEGIDEQLIDQFEFPKEKELKKALNKVDQLNKTIGHLPMRKKKDKVSSTLLNLGFDYEIVNEVIEQLKPIDKKYFEEQLKVDFDKIKRVKEKRYFGSELKKAISKDLLTKGYEFEDIMDILKENGIYEKN